VKSGGGGGGSAGNSIGTEMPSWTTPPASFNGFDNYNGLATEKKTSQFLCLSITLHCSGVS
jgi:hypothetical protein